MKIVSRVMLGHSHELVSKAFGTDDTLTELFHRTFASAPAFLARLANNNFQVNHMYRLCDEDQRSTSLSRKKMQRNEMF